MSGLGSHQQTVGAILERLSGHLDTLAEQVFDIEQAVGISINSTSNTSGATITELQGLDFLRQSLEDTALLIHFLYKSDKCPTDDYIDTRKIAERLKLNSTQNLLQGTRGQIEQLGKDTTGELDLF